jgi:hypothetical protein
MLPALECRFVACAVPDVQNLNALRFLAHVIENAIRTHHNFAQFTSRALGIGWSNIWKVCQNSNLGAATEWHSTKSKGSLRSNQSRVASGGLIGWSPREDYLARVRICASFGYQMLYSRHVVHLPYQLWTFRADRALPL